MPELEIFLEEFEAYQAKCVLGDCSSVEVFMDKQQALQARKQHQEENPGHPVLISYHEYEADRQAATEHSEILKIPETGGENQR